MGVALITPAYVYAYGYSESTYYGYGYGQVTYYGYGQVTYYGYGQGSYQTTFIGNVAEKVNFSVAGDISKATGSFVIDHPLDPKNKLLYHSFVESPDAMNIYDGIVTLDENGSAEIELPGYFVALNTEYRYLGTPVGQPMPNLFLARGVKKRYLLFGAPVLKISGGVSGGKVSWQVTGVRRDPYILAHPIVTEVEKGPGKLVEQGEYLFPEYYAK